jgi:hypothetical protein
MQNKKLLTLRAFHQNILQGMQNAQDLLPVVQLGKLVKKLSPCYEAIDEAIEDLRLDHCAKEDNIILRDEKGGYKWTADGEKAFRKAYRSLLEQEAKLPDFLPLNYDAFPEDFKKANPWEAMEEMLSPFYVNEPEL